MGTNNCYWPFRKYYLLVFVLILSKCCSLQFWSSIFFHHFLLRTHYVWPTLADSGRHQFVSANNVLIGNFLCPPARAYSLNGWSSCGTTRVRACITCTRCERGQHRRSVEKLLYTQKCLIGMAQRIRRSLYQLINVFLIFFSFRLSLRVD